MPSHRADVTPLKVRRQRTGRSGESTAVDLTDSPSGFPSFPGHGLPPGVVDTRPVGVQMVDIRDPFDVTVHPVDAAQDSFADFDAILDPQSVEDPDRAWASGLLRGSDLPPETVVPVPDGYQLHNGVLDTRPKGLPVAPRIAVSGPLVVDVGRGAQLTAWQAHDLAMTQAIDVPVGESPRATRPVDDLPEFDSLFQPVVEPTTGGLSRTRRPAARSSRRGSAPVDGSPATASLPVDTALVAAAAQEAAARPVAAPDKPSPYMRRADLRKRAAAKASKRPGASLSVSHVGIAGALGLATIAAPLSGVFSSPNVTSSAAADQALSALALTPAPAFPQVAHGPGNAVEDQRLVKDETQVSAVPGAISAPGRVLVTQASRGNERPVLPGCNGVLPSDLGDVKNGRLPASALCTLWDGQSKLRSDAAVSLAKLNVAYYQHFGRNLCLVDSYRTLAAQYAIKNQRPAYAATPGTSEHGWGVAIDICGGSGVSGTETYTWLRANGPRYGWVNPNWALPGGPGPTEPWHWEWLPGEKTGPGGD